MERAKARWLGRPSGSGHAPGTVFRAAGSAAAAADSGHDDELVRLMQERDPDAFELVYERHAAIALGLAQRIVRERGLAEDVVQEAFISAWRSCADYRPERGSVRTWILGITRNRALDALRRTSSQARVRANAEAYTERSVEREPTESAAVRADEARSLRAAMVSLPDGQRKAIELAFFAGLTQNEIARSLELPLGTVKGRMRLGLGKLRLALGPSTGAA